MVSRATFNGAQSGGKKISLADTIVIGRLRRRRAGGERAGYEVTVPFTPGRMDASQEQTDPVSFAFLEPKADGFRNYRKAPYAVTAEATCWSTGAAPDSDRPRDDGSHRRYARPRRQLRGHDSTESSPSVPVSSRPTSSSICSIRARSGSRRKRHGLFEGRDRQRGALLWTASRVDLIFGANAQLRALAEVYACADSGEKFVHDFVAAWSKVMNLDRFDLL